MATRPILTQFGIRLRAFRKAHGWTQADLATQSGLDRSYLSDVERGKKGVGIDTLAILAGSFRVSMSALVKGIEQSAEVSRG